MQGRQALGPQATLARYMLAIQCSRPSDTKAARGAGAGLRRACGTAAKQ